MSENASLEIEEGSSTEEQLRAIDKELQQVSSKVAQLLARQEHLMTKRDRLTQILEEETIAKDSAVPQIDWQHHAFPWDERVKSILKDVFHLSEFRPQQKQVINATLQGNDVLCLLPSGMGKSLCYQVPALISEPGLTLVVSPLLSLIQDQLQGLRSLGIRAAALTSHTPKEEVNATLANMGKDDVGPLLVYVTPEKIVASKRLLSKIEKLNQAGRFSRVVVDEAHCCSAWGNDFRPDYKKLSILKQQFPKVPIIALTATATHQVCEDIKGILGIQRATTFKHSINRPNLFYEVQHNETTNMQSLAADIVAWIQRHFKNKETGIIYCLTRKDCEQLSQELNQGGRTSARPYHADLDISTREAAHIDWSAGRVQLMVATIAFGMGINNTNVRFVVHASISKSIENYYQESGRAGRDGLPARCLLLYRFSDVMRQAAIICMDSSWSSSLLSMSRYAAASGRCRRAVIQQHFAEPPAECDGQCDVCASGSGVEKVDITAHAMAILRALQGLSSAEKRATVIQLVDAWRKGKKTDAEAAKAARTMARAECEEIIADMVLKGLLQLDFGFTAYTTNTYLKASERGRCLLDAQPGAMKPLVLERMAGQHQQREQQQQQQEQQRPGGQGRSSEDAGGCSLGQRRTNEAEQGNSGAPGGDGPKSDKPGRRKRKGSDMAEQGSKEVVVIESDSDPGEEFMDRQGKHRCGS